MTKTNLLKDGWSISFADLDKETIDIYDEAEQLRAVCLCPVENTLEAVIGDLNYQLEYWKTAINNPFRDEEISYIILAISKCQL